MNPSNEGQLDLEQALAPNPPPTDPRAQGASNSLAVRQNLSNELRRTINNSVHLNVAFACFAIIKVVVSLGVLLFTETECDKPINKWLIFMILHDGLYATCQLLLAKQILRTNYGSAAENDADNMQDDPQNNGDMTVFSLSDQAERRNKVVSALAEICRVYYVVLFIYGQILYYQDGSNCPQVAESANTLVLIYICLAYCYIGIPIIIIILACLCMPVLIFIAILLSRRAQVPAKSEFISKLPVVKYHKDLPGSHDCSICINEYVENDDIIQLKCSPMHHFHSECLKKWLIINGLCPICRAKLDPEARE